MDNKIIIPIAIAFGVGGGIGFLIASKVSEAHWQEIAKNEIDDVKAYYREKYEGKQPIVPDPETPEKKQYRKLAKEYVKPSPEELVKQGRAKDLMEDDVDLANYDPEMDEDGSALLDDVPYSEEENEESDLEEEEEQPVEEVREKREDPYIIGYDEFVAENGHDKIDLYFYRLDEIVCDVNDQVYVIPEDTIGVDWMKDLAKKAIVFVRNDILETDYEIHALAQSYNDEVATRLETDTEKRFRQIARQKKAIDTMSDEFIQADAELKRKGEKKKAAYVRPKKSKRVAYNQIPLAEQEEE